MMSSPAELRYSKEHEWVRVQGDRAVIGITAHAANELGDVVFVDLPQVGATLKQFAVFGAVESVKAVSDLFSPISGSVLARNEALSAAPESINADPYGSGWLLEIQIGDPAELNLLLDAAGYDQLTA
jgi:glycine cleavage system H protein